MAGTFFGLLALGAFAIALFAHALLLGLVLGTLFGTVALFFALECIPPWIELGDDGIRFRRRLGAERVLWSEVAALGTSVPTELSPGALLVRLTAAACQARRGLDPNAMYHIDVPALDSCGQRQLLEHARARWQLAGGDGSTFDAHPQTAAALDQMRGKREPGVVGLAQPPAPDDIYCMVMHVRRDSGELFFCIVAGGADLARLSATIAATSDRLVREHRFNPEFGGALEVSLVPDLTPDTAALRARMDALVWEIEDGFRRSGIAATGARPIRMSWAHGHPQREPAPA